jgi:hypothetical protein
MVTRQTRWSLLAVPFIAASLAFLLVLKVGGQPENISINPAMAEARSILTRGSVALPERLWDTAIDDGRFLNIFQPGQTLLFLAQIRLAGDSALTAWKTELYALFVLSSALLAMALGRLAGDRVALAIPVAASTMLGAPYIASFPKALAGSVHRSNHVFAIPFIAGVLYLLTGRRTARRMWGVGACIGGAMMFRAQNLLLLAIPVCMLFQDAEGRSWQILERLRTGPERARLAGDLARLLAGPIAAAIVIVGFNIARFGAPFESGYMAIYDGRTDYLALRAHEYGLWSPHFLPENLSRTLFAFPSLSFSGLRISNIAGNPLGNSLLFSQPIFLVGIALWRGVGSPRVQAFLLGAVLLTIPVLTYHNAGLEAPGYMRYSLDYLFLWAATMVVASRYVSLGPKWTTLAWVLAAWAIYYGVALVVVPPTV